SLVKALTGRLVMPLVDEKALEGLKFSDALPRHLAEVTLATRLADLDRAAEVLAEPVRFEHLWMTYWHLRMLRGPSASWRGRPPGTEDVFSQGVLLAFAVEEGVVGF